MKWSDGEDLTADDFIFTVNTVMDLQLGANWAQLVHAAFVDRVEALDSHRLKIFLKSTNADGNPQTPGLSVWQFGLTFMPILPEHYWASVVEKAKQAGGTAQQIEALFAHVPDGEPTANGLAFGQWEPGAFFENDTVPSFFQKGAVVSEFANGAYQETNERLGYTEVAYGDAAGDTVLEYEIGPHFETEIFSIYGNQDSAILALTTGDIDFLFNPLGLEKGFLDRVRQAPDLEVVTNLDNGVFYLGVAPLTRQSFQFGQGEVRLMDVGQTWVRIEGREVVTLVLFNEEGTLPLLGALALEGVFMGVDPVAKRLMPVEGLMV